MSESMHQVEVTVNKGVLQLPPPPFARNCLTLTKDIFPVSEFFILSSPFISLVYRCLFVSSTLPPPVGFCHSVRTMSSTSSSVTPSKAGFLCSIKTASASCLPTSPLLLLGELSGFYSGVLPSKVLRSNR